MKNFLFIALLIVLVYSSNDCDLGQFRLNN